MYKYSEVNSVHLEISELCNASCPQCARNINGGEDNPFLHNAQLTLDDIKNIFKPNFIKKLRKLYMCGNYGDPITAKDTKEVFSYLRSFNSEMQLSMHTNGGARNAEWWSELPKSMGSNHYVVFGLDGLHDTNHIYRQGTSWEKIMINVEAFIRSGGKARWDFIVFAHNEHQVEEAKKLSEKMGFYQFNIKKTSRFYAQDNNTSKLGHQAGNHKGEKTYFIEPPKDSKYQNEAIKKLINNFDGKQIDSTPFYSMAKDLEGRRRTQIFNHDENKKTSIEKYWDSVDIKCRVVDEKSIFVTAEGYVLPCCWTASEMYHPWIKSRSAQIWNAIDEVGLENLDAKKNDLQSIIDGKFFQEVIPNRWKMKSCADGKLAVCAKNCAVNNDIFSAQFNWGDWRKK